MDDKELGELKNYGKTRKYPAKGSVAE